MADSTASSAVVGVRSSRICRVYGIAPSTLQYWVRLGLVAPSLVASSGKRFERWWAIDDVVRVRMIMTLRGCGCSLQKVRVALDHLRRMGVETSTSHLVWDGTEIFAVNGWGEAIAAFRDPGQLAFQALVMPISEWTTAIVPICERIDVLEEQTRRRQVGSARAQARRAG